MVFELRVKCERRTSLSVTLDPYCIVLQGLSWSKIDQQRHKGALAIPLMEMIYRAPRETTGEIKNSCDDTDRE